jgi:hypothetical protein
MGTTAFLLNFIPILGPLFGVGIFALVGMLSFDSLWWALLPPVLYFCIHLVEGETLTPMLLARRFTLNAPGHVRTTVSNAFENCVLQQAFFSRARIRNDKRGNCQNAANEQHQENRPA